MNRRINEQAEKKNRWRNEQTEKRTDGEMNRRRNKWTVRWLNERGMIQQIQNDGTFDEGLISSARTRLQETFGD